MGGNYSIIFSCLDSFSYLGNNKSDAIYRNNLMAHLLLACDMNDRQHKEFVKAVSERKYQLEGIRKGYNRPHVSEIRFYNIRVKKEVLPHLSRDLGGNTYISEKKLSLWNVIKGPNKSGKDAFFDGRLQYIVMYILQKMGKFIRIEPVPTSDKERVPFIAGWDYIHKFGTIKDIDRGQGEEL